MANIAAAITFVLKNEDSRLTGKVTTDAGGRTRFGIAQKFHPELDESFYTGPKDQALVTARKIYQDQYALPLHIDQFTSQPIANKVLDIGINCGIGIAAGMIQNGVCDLGIHVAIDREIGPITIAAINQANSISLMSRLITLSQNYYRKDAIHQHATADELASWLTRAGKPGI